jgi:hypothetical protein
MEAMYTMKNNGETFMEVSHRTKYDSATKATENTSVTQYGKGEPTQNYSYQDPNRSIWKGSFDDTYFVTEYSQPLPSRDRAFRDPFKEQGAAELEKVFDAIVGNLKDYVQAENGTDGGKTYSASLSEAQVPALVNAIASFGFKKILVDEGRSNRDLNIPQIESDIYVKKVTGLASQQKSGTLENITGEIVLSGKDKDGNVHDLSVGVTARMTAVGETKIVMPDLTNANVTRAEQGDNGLNSKYVGKYKNNIVIEKNGQFVKAGERVLEITGVEQGRVIGTFTETVKPEFEKEIGEPLVFTFNEKSESGNGPFYIFTTSAGEKGSFQLFPNGMGNVFMHTQEMPVSVAKRMDNFGAEFNRVYE